MLDKIVIVGLVAGAVLIGIVAYVVIRNRRIKWNDLIMAVVGSVLITFSHWTYISIGGGWIEFSKAVESLNKVAESVTSLEGELKKTVDSLGVKLHELSGELDLLRKKYEEI